VPDQANQLRRLVRQRGEADFSQRAPRPRLVLLSGGKGGVGTTTVAVNLAVALAGRGWRTVLVDADPRGGNVAVLCGLEERFTLADVLARRRTLPESLQSGPGGIRVLAGDWRWNRLPGEKTALGNRLLAQLEGLDTQADVIVVDAGNGPNDALRPLVRAADMVLAVTTAETPAVLDTYAWIKTLAADGIAAAVHTLVNRVPSAEVARSVQDRLSRACRRFLALDLPGAGHVPADRQAGRAIAAGAPLVLIAPRSSAARHVQRLARLVSPPDPKPPLPSADRSKARKPEKEEILTQPLAIISR